jgi:glycosyltransferase involved in cell wall biosynthesis
MENKLTIIIPAYNEEESLKTFFPEVIDFAGKNNFSVILINDGSADGTRSMAESIAAGNTNVKIINHKVNKGYGAAIKSGISMAETPFIVTIDGDGQHYLEDILKLLFKLNESDADMIIGSRKGRKIKNYYRHIGKSIIRNFAKLIMTVPIYDINSGMKLYDSTLAKKYILLCPDDMAFSDIIALIFINQKHLVIEEPIQIRKREKGKSTISLSTASKTLLAILHILLLFNPLRFFLPIAFINILFGIGWGLFFLFVNHQVSNGAIISIISGLLFFFIGLIADQISMFRKERLK